MYSFYNQTDDLTFPNGKTYSSMQLKTNSAYSILFVGTPVIKTNEDGITYEMSQLGDLKEQYNVQSEDPQTALDEINEIIAGTHPKPETIADIQSQLNALTSAFTTTEVANA